MVFGRLIYSTGRDGIWWGPVNRWLAYLSPRFRSPVIATVIVALVAALATLMGERYLVIFLSGDVSAYALISSAILLGRPRDATGRHYRSPCYPALPLFCVIFTALAVAADWMDPDAGRPSTILLSSLFGLALLYYFARLRGRPATWLPVPQAAAAVPDAE
jgi:amino acid transporter